MNVDFDRFLRAKRRFSRPGRPARSAGSLLLRKRCAGLTIRTANNASHGRSPDAPVGGRVSQSHPPAGLIVIIQYTVLSCSEKQRAHQTAADRRRELKGANTTLTCYCAPPPAFLKDPQHSSAGKYADGTRRDDAPPTSAL